MSTLRARILATVPSELGHEADPETLVPTHGRGDRVASGERSPPQDRLGDTRLGVFGGAAVGIMPAVLREHMGMDEIRASATFIAATIAVVSLTLPLVRILQARIGALSTFVGATIVQGVRSSLSATRASRWWRLPSTASSSYEQHGRRLARGRPGAAVEHEHQGLLNLFVGTLGLAGFLCGIIIAAGLPDRSVQRRPRAPRHGDGGAALAFRRSLAAA